MIRYGMEWMVRCIGDGIIFPWTEAEAALFKRTV
jgi:hypothetical protein